MQLVALLLALLAAPTAALRVAPMRPAAAAIRAAQPTMAWEWFTEASGPQGEKFKRGEDYLFFQGPTSKTGYQDDLPNFFSKENFADFQITPLQIAVTVTGIGSFAVVASALL